MYSQKFGGGNVDRSKATLGRVIDLDYRVHYSELDTRQ